MIIKKLLKLGHFNKTQLSFFFDFFRKINKYVMK